MSKTVDLPLPEVRFEDFAEFGAFAERQRSVLDVRLAYEHSLATNDDSLMLNGTCGLCLTPTRYLTSAKDGQRLANGKILPDWRNGQRCGCAFQLISRQRAMLQFLLSAVGLEPWIKVLLFGADQALLPVLEARVGKVTDVRRMDLKRGDKIHGGGVGLEAADAEFHLVISGDHLQRVPALDQALSEILRVMKSGGLFVFTVPFRAHASSTRSFTSGLHEKEGGMSSELPYEVHEIGWDLLDRLRDIGFIRASAHLYWSEELGYLGAYNMLFSARKP